MQTWQAGSESGRQLTGAEGHSARTLLAPDQQIQDKEDGEADSGVKHGGPQPVALPAVALEHAEQPCRLQVVTSRRYW